MRKEALFYMIVKVVKLIKSEWWFETEIIASTAKNEFCWTASAEADSKTTS